MTGAVHNVWRFRDPDGADILAVAREMLGGVLSDELLDRVLGVDFLDMFASGIGRVQGARYIHTGLIDRRSHEIAFAAAKGILGNLALEMQRDYPYDGSRPRRFSTGYGYAVNVAKVDEDGFAYCRWENILADVTGFEIEELRENVRAPHEENGFTDVFFRDGVYSQGELNGAEYLSLLWEEEDAVLTDDDLPGPIVPGYSRYDLAAGEKGEIQLLDAAGCTAKGLPSGVKYDKKTGALTGTPKKAGTYKVTLSKKVDGKKVSATFEIAVAVPAPAFEVGVDGVFAKGVEAKAAVVLDGVEGEIAKLTASALPSGLKLVKEDGRWFLQGVPKAAKTFKTKFTAYAQDGKKSVKLGVVEYPIEVVALPGWAVGTFSGAILENAPGYNPICPIEAVVTEAGKVSGKIGAAKFSAKSLSRLEGLDYDCYCFRSTFKGVTGTMDFIGYLYEADGGHGSLEIMAGEGSQLRGGVAIQILRLKKELKGKVCAFPTGKAALKIDALKRLPTVSAKFGKDGKVTWKGTVPGDDGKALKVSGTATFVTLGMSEDGKELSGSFLIYVAPRKNLQKGFRLDIPLVLARDYDRKLMTAILREED